MPIKDRITQAMKFPADMRKAIGKKMATASHPIRFKLAAQIVRRRSRFLFLTTSLWLLVPLVALIAWSFTIPPKPGISPGLHWATVVARAVLMLLMAAEGTWKVVRRWRRFARKG